jgi:hypothetical protein
LRANAPSDGVLAAMIIEKIPVDRLASRKSLGCAMPVIDVRFVHAPAQVDFLAAKQSREIDQTDIEVLHQDTHFLDPLHRVLQRLRTRIILRFPGFGRRGVDGNAAHHQNALCQILQKLFGFLRADLCLNRFPNTASDGRQGGTGFSERKVSRHRSDTDRFFVLQRGVVRVDVAIQNIDEFGDDTVATQGGGKLAVHIDRSHGLFECAGQ